jgi:hypothetical protein
MKPLCFVLIALNLKPGPGGGVIDFNAVSADLIAPAERWQP